MGVEDEAAHKAEAGFEIGAAGSSTLGARCASRPLPPPPPPPQLKEAAELCALIVLERARGAGLGGDVLLSSAPPSRARVSPAQAGPDPHPRRPAPKAGPTAGWEDEALKRPGSAFPARTQRARARGTLPPGVAWRRHRNRGCVLARAWAWPHGGFNLVLLFLRFN